MSSEHKRPLYAFAIVALICALFVGSGLRSDALTGLLQTVHVPAPAPTAQSGPAPVALGDPQPLPQVPSTTPAPAASAAASPVGDRRISTRATGRAADRRAARPNRSLDRRAGSEIQRSAPPQGDVTRGSSVSESNRRESQGRPHRDPAHPRAQERGQSQDENPGRHGASREDKSHSHPGRAHGHERRHAGQQPRGRDGQSNGHGHGKSHHRGKAHGGKAHGHGKSHHRGKAHGGKAHGDRSRGRGRH